MRYINADDFLDLFYVASMGQDKAFVKVVEQVVEDTPTADAIEVVKCKDCRHFDYSQINNRGFRICQASKMDITENDFCSYGERRKDDEVRK